MEPNDPTRRGLLFLCVANSTRSQMAEGFARFLGPSDFPVFSASASPGTVSPLAVRAMKEVGIDISAHRAKGLDAVPLDRVATVITLCDEEPCPPLPDGVHHLHWPLPDPLAALSDPGVALGSDDDLMADFRRVRDQIRELISRLF